MPRKTLTIDWTRCDGHGLCATVAPQLVAIDEWGYPLLRRATDDADQHAARRAAAVCPTLALRVRPENAPQS